MTGDLVHIYIEDYSDIDEILVYESQTPTVVVNDKVLKGNYWMDSYKSNNESIIKDIKNSMKGNMSYSLDLQMLQDISSDSDVIDAVFNNQVEIVSESNPKLAEFLTNIVSIARQKSKHHKAVNTESIKKAIETKKEKADRRANKLLKIIEKLESENNFKNDNEVAAALTESEILTPQGKKTWHFNTVRRIKARAHRKPS